MTSFILWTFKNLLYKSHVHITRVISVGQTVLANSLGLDANN